MARRRNQAKDILKGRRGIYDEENQPSWVKHELDPLWMTDGSSEKGLGLLGMVPFIGPALSTGLGAVSKEQDFDAYKKETGGNRKQYEEAGGKLTSTADIVGAVVNTAAQAYGAYANSGGAGGEAGPWGDYNQLTSDLSTGNIAGNNLGGAPTAGGSAQSGFDMGKAMDIMGGMGGGMKGQKEEQTPMPKMPPVIDAGNPPQVKKFSEGIGNLARSSAGGGDVLRTPKMTPVTRPSNEDEEDRLFARSQTPVYGSMGRPGSGYGRVV